MNKYDLILTFPFLRIGGLENLIINIIRELDRKKINFAFITLYTDDNVETSLTDFKKYIIKPHHRIEMLMKIKFLRYLIGPILYTIILAKYSKLSEKFLSFELLPTYILCFLKSINKKISIYYFECDVLIPGGVLIDFKDNYQKLVQYFLHLFQIRLDKIFLKKVECIIVIDDKNLSYAKYHYKKIIKKYFLIYPLTNLDSKNTLSFTHNKKLLKIFKSKSRKLSIIGTLDAKKNTVEALKLLSYLKEKNLYYELLIIGSGELEQELKSKAQELNLLKEVHFLGKLSYEDLDYVYQNIYCNLFYAKHQTWGLTPFEALKFNKPSIVSTEAGCAEYLKKRKINHIHDLSKNFNCCEEFLEKEGLHFKYDKTKLYNLSPDFYIKELLSVIF